jgi:hypothetical protein
MMYRAPMVLSLAGKAEAVLVDIVITPITLQDRDRWAESIAAICAGTVLVITGTWESATRKSLTTG